jgi:branched-chain amino acid transport system substrate-binding protein
MRAFLEACRAAYNGEPDAFAAAQFDAVGMLGKVIAELRAAGIAPDGASVRERLASETYQRLVTTYRSDGNGNMTHDAQIVCFDGTDRVPKAAARYTVTP